MSRHLPYFFAISAACALTALNYPSLAMAGDGVADDCTAKGFKLMGDVQVVDSFPDLKVQIVTSFPDLKVQWVDSFPDACGKWKEVTSFPDIKIQYVDSFPDIKIEIVSSFPGLP